ncbi:amidohydrolase [Cutibacterium sp. WCA-380-WT-3A]|uniref:Amidohydrolase n=1 Tax=Cutibacterium porci TaxID=2605781 RepID=A0A7K0J5G1_9ACTN|nr:amidohydrolase [Cutibacterium porci]MSS45174.1 amidohydrolase [Cutibacterium porci]
MTIDDVLASAEAITSWQEDLYKDLHRHPELSMQEQRTRTVIANKLAEFGYDVHEVGGGLVGVLANGPGKTVLFRADFDALPVKENTGLDYASTDTGTTIDGETTPVMHACGHDMHTAAALGAASLMANHRDAWSGTYIALFQPGEEIAAGAKAMVDDNLGGVIPKPDVALGQHVLGDLVSGHVGTAAGPVLSTAASLRITVFGKGSHGSMPHLGIDPVLLASNIVVRLQSIVAREIAPSDFGVVTVGSLHAGNSANVIPAEATLQVNVRAYDEDIRDHIIEAITRIVDSECEGMRAPQQPRIEVFDTYPLTDNDQAVYETVTKGLVRGLGEGRVETLNPQTASEDFSIIPDALGAPYCYWGFGAFTADQDVLPNHNPGFAPALQPTLTTGTQAAVAAALAFLGH